MWRIHLFDSVVRCVFMARSLISQLFSTRNRSNSRSGLEKLWLSAVHPRHERDLVFTLACRVDLETCTVVPKDKFNLLTIRDIPAHRLPWGTIYYRESNALPVMSRLVYLEIDIKRIAKKALLVNFDLWDVSLDPGNLPASAFGQKSHLS